MIILTSKCLNRLTSEQLSVINLLTYSRRNMQTFTQQVQTPLSLKQKPFSGFFKIYMKWRTESTSLSISEIIDSKRGGYLSAWKALPQNSFR